MHPRLSLDIGWSDLGYAALASALAGARGGRATRLEARFSPYGDAFAALSARSGFDLYLRALALPPGSEVLVSGLTIAHMVQILSAHGLVPVPFALDPDTLAPAPGELERRRTARTRAVLFAHLFGQRADLEDLVAYAKRHELLVWEDCAQAFSGDAWRGHPAVDLALFSFGLIKTATAIQGGILRVRAPALRARMRALQAEWAVQPRRDFLRRVGKATLLRTLGRRWLFTRFARACARSGKDLDQVLHDATRGFPGPQFLERLRRAPSAPLLALLERRLGRPAASNAAARRAFGEELLEALGPEVQVFGRRALARQHWVFALGCDEPAQLVAALRAAGFDASARSSLIAVEHGAGGAAPAANRTLLERLVYVPLALQATHAERVELARILREHTRVRALVPHGGRAPVAQPPGA